MISPPSWYILIRSMNEDLLLVAFLAFTAGYIFKTMLYGLRAFSAAANFVEAVAQQSLRLLGSTVYKTSYVEQICTLMLEKSGQTEEAKILRLDMEHQFGEWREGVVEEFIKNYPEHYKWQLTFDDWKGALKELDNIYKERKV